MEEENLLKEILEEFKKMNAKLEETRSDMSLELRQIKDYLFKLTK